MSRRPAVAGQFYEGRGEALRSQIEGLFKSKMGPGSPPKQPGSEGRVVGAVVPHAGYVYSGAVAAWSYSAIYKDRRPGSFVILGPNHHGVGSGVSLFPEGTWETPLGAASIDDGLARAILKTSSIIDKDTEAHAYEHSIEVQIPFLQYLFGGIRFVPISMMLQDLETATEVGRDIAKAAKAEGADVVVIASTDFSHYVPPDVAHRNDDLAIQRILAMDAQGLFRVVEEESISMCGYGPVMAAIEACTAMGAKRGELLKYATSGDVMPMREVVGYASIAMVRG